MRLTGGLAENVDEGRSLTILDSMRKELAAPALEMAQEAEAKTERYKKELSEASDTGRKVAVTLQAIIGSQEAELNERRMSFDAQLAQAQLDLDAANRQVESVNAEARGRRNNLLTSIADQEARLRTKERRLIRVIYMFFSAIAAVASIISILVPDYSTPLFRFLLLAIYVVSLRFVGAQFKRFAATIAAKVFSSHRKYIEGLKQGAN